VIEQIREATMDVHISNHRLYEWKRREHGLWILLSALPSWCTHKDQRGCPNSHGPQRVFIPSG
jgi:hypothetical protein